MKGIRYITFSMIILAYLVIVLGFTSREYEIIPCREISIRVHDSLNYRFMNDAKIRNLIRENGFDLVGKSLSGIDLENLEETLYKIRSVKKAEVFRTIDGRITIDVYQRKPVIGIIDRGDRKFYLDEEGEVFPVSNNFAPHILFANGNINEKIRSMNNIDDDTREGSVLNDLFRIALYIDGDEFLHSQIEQIYVNDDNELEMIPRVGSQIIDFGTAENFEYKFQKLKIIYLEGFHYTGWNQYERINLKYGNQVVCTKR